MGNVLKFGIKNLNNLKVHLTIDNKTKKKIKYDKEL